MSKRRNAARVGYAAIQQAVAARRLDSFILKHLPFAAAVGCCSLGAAEQRRSATLTEDIELFLISNIFQVSEEHLT
ncbi:MAG: hypothetical protein ACRD9R_15680 [Pyrinomonadaceae bacterium]